MSPAADRAGRESVAQMERIAATVPPQQALPAMLRAYLSKAHVEGVETGCATAALCSEMPRQAPEVRRNATRRIKEMIDLVARQSPDWGQPARTNTPWSPWPRWSARWRWHVLSTTPGFPKRCAKQRCSTSPHPEPALPARSGSYVELEYDAHHI